ncbi:MAG: hypothetical protein AB7E21_01280 [Pseudodonghicola sp.]
MILTLFTLYGQNAIRIDDFFGDAAGDPKMVEAEVSRHTSTREQSLSRSGGAIRRNGLRSKRDAIFSRELVLSETWDFPGNYWRLAGPQFRDDLGNWNTRSRPGATRPCFDRRPETYRAPVCWNRR